LPIAPFLLSCGRVRSLIAFFQRKLEYMNRFVLVTG
jgi:hypothetical protein